MGAISTIPFVYHEKLFFGSFLEKIFFHLSTIQFSFFWEWLYFSLGLFFLSAWGIMFAISYFFQEKKKAFFSILSLSAIAFFALLVLWVGLIALFSGGLKQDYSSIAVGFWSFSFATLGLIVSYYIIISFLEEWLKFLSSLGFSGRADYFVVFQKFICLSACIALGFAFYENILYTWSFASGKWLSDGIVGLVFFRSVFSVILHLVSSLLFALGFWYIFHASKNLLTQIASFVLVASLGLASHVFFDVFLTFGYIWYVFFYIVGIYLFLSYLTTTENQ